MRPSNWAHSNPEVCTYLVQWITENCRPVQAVEDWQLHVLLSAGCPFINLPSHMTCSRDIIAAYKEAHKVVTKLLQEMPSYLHFDTDAWTSPNHCAFIVWMVQFEFQGEIVNFLLEIIKVPEVCILICSLDSRLTAFMSHTGAALTRAFQAMLE